MAESLKDPPYDFRRDPTLIARAEHIALGLIAGRRLSNGDESILAHAVVRQVEEQRAEPNADATLFVVEGVVERDALQRQLDPTRRRFLVVTAMGGDSSLIGRRFKAIFVRYPSIAWFDAKKVETHQFQEWERQYVMPRLASGGHFTHI